MQQRGATGSQGEGRGGRCGAVYTNYRSAAAAYHKPHLEGCLAIIRLAVVTQCFVLNLSEAEKGFAALSGREADFKKSLDTAVEYALLLSCTKSVLYNYVFLRGVKSPPPPPLPHHRVHVLAGVVTGDRGKAEQTYVSNLRLAAHECTKVGVYISM